MRIKQQMIKRLSKFALSRGIVSKEDLYTVALDSAKRFLSELDDFVVDAYFAAAVSEKEKRRQADGAGK